MKQLTPPENTEQKGRCFVLPPMSREGRQVRPSKLKWRSELFEVVTRHSMASLPTPTQAGLFFTEPPRDTHSVHQ
jgi:hypothetical protein